jgi:hypothetical protein
MCAVKHDPENDSYGDCVRACIASILELPSEDVPHFYNTPDTTRCQVSMQRWLAKRGLIIATVPLPGDMSKIEMFAYMDEHFNFYHYMLWCSSGGGDHAVCCLNDRVTHNPAWYKCPVDGPHSSNFWIIWIIAKL